jgi:hypothetical protein
MIDLQFQVDELSNSIAKLQELQSSQANSHISATASASEDNQSKGMRGSGTSVVPAVPAVSTKMETMQAIGARTGTDKVTHHHYDFYYPRFVEGLRHKPAMKMLEIGFLFGQSYLMWKEYFPNGQVYFIDIAPGTTYPEARYTGDAGDRKVLEALLSEKQIKGDLDLIVDDGSHYPPHQLASFEYLFLEGLKPGGIYILEDIETSYWKRGECYGYYMKYGKDHPDSLMTRARAFVDVVNRKFSLPSAPFRSAFGREVDSWVSGVFYGLNNVIITKATKDEYDVLNAAYQYPDNL